MRRAIVWYPTSTFFTALSPNKQALRGTTSTSKIRHLKRNLVSNAGFFHLFGLLYRNQTGVGELVAAGIVNVKRKHVDARLERHQRFATDRKRLVKIVGARQTRGRGAVDINLGSVIVAHGDLQVGAVGELLRREREFVSRPDVVGCPIGANCGAIGGARTKTGVAGFPARIVVIRAKPLARRLRQRVLPASRRSFFGSRHDVRDDRRRWHCGPVFVDVFGGD